MILVLKAAIFLSQTDFCIEGVTKLPQSVEDMKFASHLTPVGPHPILSKRDMMADQNAKNQRCAAKGRFTRKLSELTKSIEEDQGSEIVRVNF